MSENFGALCRAGGYVTAVMERQVDATPAEVWSLLAEESNRVKWLAPGTIDLAVGGRAQLDFSDSYVIVDSEVTACEPGKSLGFSWSGGDDPARPVLFELEAADGGCVIRLTVSIPENEVVARSCAGWEAHLTMLQAAIAGIPIKFPLDRFKDCRAAFDKELLDMTMAECQVLRL